MLVATHLTYVECVWKPVAGGSRKQGGSQVYDASLSCCSFYRGCVMVYRTQAYETVFGTTVLIKDLQTCFVSLPFSFSFGFLSVSGKNTSGSILPLRLLEGCYDVDLEFSL